MLVHVPVERIVTDTRSIYLVDLYALYMFPNIVGQTEKMFDFVQACLTILGCAYENRHKQ